MKRIITIDLVKDIKLDLTIEEHETALILIRNSLKLKKREIAKQPMEATLFPPSEFEKKKASITTFENSEVNNFEIFKTKMEKEEKLGIDIFYYYNSVLDWSLTNPKKFRTSVGWIATARQFMRSDNDRKKLKMTIEKEGQRPMSREQELEYLNT